MIALRRDGRGVLGWIVLGSVIAGSVIATTPAAAQSDPNGPAPRLSNGRPDFSGVWVNPYVPDMTRSNPNGPRPQRGAGELPFTDAGTANIQAYHPEDGDYTGMCMPFGLTRSMNSPYPFQIFQSDGNISFLFEINTWFHVVPFQNSHPANLEPTWFGSSVGRWDGDTLVIETVGFNGFTRLDTRGHPHSDKLTLTQRFTRVDAGHISYVITVDDPVYYTKPWSNERTFTLSTGELLEYSCEENNRSLWEGRIKIWVPPTSSQPRQFKGN